MVYDLNYLLTNLVIIEAALIALLTKSINNNKNSGFYIWLNLPILIFNYH